MVFSIIYINKNGYISRNLYQISNYDNLTMYKNSKSLNIEKSFIRYYLNYVNHLIRVFADNIGKKQNKVKRGSLLSKGKYEQKVERYEKDKG